MVKNSTATISKILLNRHIFLTRTQLRRNELRQTKGKPIFPEIWTICAGKLKDEWSDSIEILIIYCRYFQGYNISNSLDKFSNLKSQIIPTMKKFCFQSSFIDFKILSLTSHLIRSLCFEGLKCIVKIKISEGLYRCILLDHSRSLVFSYIVAVNDVIDFACPNFPYRI